MTKNYWGRRLRRPVAVILAFLLPLCLSACTGADPPGENGAWQEALTNKLTAPERSGAVGPGLTWYQVFVYSFYDSDGDGIGDLNGVTERLDYIQSMGFDGIWLSPIHPSSTYHKYNVRDYFAIDPQYGTMEDFDALIEACDARGLRVLLDLVINHTDLNHPWFTERPEFYNIADERGHGNWEQLPDGRWYECQFWGQMPDLNLQSGEVRAELEKIFAFWLERGIYGFRLDAVKDYSSGHIEDNIEILQWLNGAVKNIKPDAYLVGEVWDTTDSLYRYYDSGVDSFFSFPFAGANGRIAALLLQADASIDNYLQSTAAAFEAAKIRNPGATNAPFFTNHDMARAAGFLRRDSNLIKTAWGLSLTQPGDAFVYYGEELGMSGPGKDENKRAPMFWTDEENAAGMTSGPPDMDEVTHGFPPAVEQAGNPSSIYTYIKNAVLLRDKYPQIGRGSFEVIPAGGGVKTGAVLRAWQDSEIIVAYNVSNESAALTLPGVLQDYLSATGESPRQQGDSLTLPGYCIAVLVLS
jgi:glycosidase